MKKELNKKGWKERFELTVEDSFESIDRVKKLVGIVKANIINGKEISIFFDNRKTTEEKIMNSF